MRPNRALARFRRNVLIADQRFRAFQRNVLGAEHWCRALWGNVLVPDHRFCAGYGVSQQIAASRWAGECIGKQRRRRREKHASATPSTRVNNGWQHILSRCAPTFQQSGSIQNRPCCRIRCNAATLRWIGRRAAWLEATSGCWVCPQAGINSTNDDKRLQGPSGGYLLQDQIIGGGNIDEKEKIKGGSQKGRAIPGLSSFLDGLI